MAQPREKCGKQPTKKLMKLYWECFVDARSRNLRISEPILQSKDIAEKLGKTDFHASNGWLECFRKRHGISFKAVCSEAGDVSDETVNTWLKKIEKLIEGYEPQNIANTDESMIFFRGLPTKSLCIKKVKCTGGKRSKERLAVLFCVLMTGEIENFLVIGKAAKASVL
ncbi:Tigger transposable element-derived protein 6 [Araneus ventricosus]|uniref:Tigger transposable element-derived protein 6 n=1 Tax=Araneus ventricosus TaxID=182803 RepID=A0A4Y2SCE2_ARAVE|nr:Tigger transposable element-derived protein 6 [Araneus ventricosus]